MNEPTRIERDSMGDVEVPEDALWGAQTQRAVLNFRIGGRPMRREFIHALGRVKAAAARTNAELGLLDGGRAEAIAAAADAVAGGEHDDAFPVDVYQTGSGTSSNMNANEVIARLASRTLGEAVSPNDDVNLGQSSNDVVPTTLHVAVACGLRQRLEPALDLLVASLGARAEALSRITKTGRTHLMDAMPLTLGQEIGAWRAQVVAVRDRLRDALPRVCALAIGGTAVGTGVNAHPEFGAGVARRIATTTGLPFRCDEDRFRAIATQETSAEVAGQLRTCAIAFTKIANDLRWMNSGPLAGLGEIELEALQPGSSIMPGKVNPVLPEAVAMAGARVVGLDATVALAAQSGNFQLNVMLPVIADALLEMIELLSGSARALARSVEGFEVRTREIAEPLSRNPVLVTALNPAIGYMKAAEIAKRAVAEGRSVLDVAAEMTDLDRSELQRLLDPERLTRSGDD